MTSHAMYVGVLLAVMAQVSDTEGEPAIRDILEAHRTNAESVASMKARVRIAFQGKDPRLTELSHEFVYVKQGSHERYTKRLTSPLIVEGEFSRLPFESGRLDVQNGPSGFKSLVGFNGQLDEEGMVPADSPAHGLIGPSRISVGHGHSWIPFHLGLEVLCLDESKTVPLRTLCGQADHVSLVERPTKENQNCFIIDIQVPSGSHRIWLSPEHNFAIRRMDWTGEKRFSLQVNDFHHREGVFICRSWKARQVAENGYAVTMDGLVDLISLNQAIPDEDLYVVFPVGLPFTDQHVGKSGIWGDGKPARMFQSNAEATDWNTDRKLAYSPELRREEQSGFRTAALFVIGLLILSGGSWYAYRQWSSA
jgi:hypothetical protein